MEKIEKEKREFKNENKNEGHKHFLCSTRRVTRVVAGGKVSKISAFVVAGDGKGKVGLGKGKSVEVAEAVKKAVLRAQKKMVKFSFNNLRTISHDVEGNFGASKVFIKKAKKDFGIIAGGSVRYVFESLGIKDVVCKVYGNNNSINVIKAVFNALDKLNSVRKLMAMRNLPKEHFLIKNHKEIK